MERPGARSWSVVRSLALLAAIFAVVLGAALPSAVAASSATGHPVQLCSGDQVFVVHGDAGPPTPGDTGPSDSLKCADCLASVFASLLPPPPPPVPAAPFVRPVDRPLPAPGILTAVATIAPRPPSTAPPTS